MFWGQIIYYLYYMILRGCILNIAGYSFTYGVVDMINVSIALILISSITLMNARFN